LFNILTYLFSCYINLSEILNKLNTLKWLTNFSIKFKCVANSPVALPH